MKSRIRMAVSHFLPFENGFDENFFQLINNLLKRLKDSDSYFDRYTFEDILIFVFITQGKEKMIISFVKGELDLTKKFSKDSRYNELIFKLFKTIIFYHFLLCYFLAKSTFF